ncbi:Gfo/Idh/MocA family protein [Paenibacillus koleovorans]|uniref:Gfo/Idh/MocA family protein n=1 Tax=Paenibacillus koleovorans TaxID=121608 RepID=UPI000FD72C4B|nr:Gfo/Idh/MocA family oxidoreductase [Paenibacillus koleovorans]
MMDPIQVVLVGIGGYGNVYMKELLAFEAEEAVRLAAVVDPRPEGSSYYEALLNRSIPIYSDIESCFREVAADLTVISTPIQLHAEMTCCALAHGSHVLCEKPAAATLEEVDAMIEARDRYGKLVAIGYQWAYSPIFQALKSDIAAGAFGRPIRFKMAVLRPRGWSYYGRNQWAGRRIDERSGRWVLDSVANNASAHHLHILFFLLGQTWNSSAAPHFVEAELYRANDIENFDTSFIRAFAGETVEVLFYATHAVNREETRFRLEFEHAVVSYDDGDGRLRVACHDGTRKDYGPLDVPHSVKWESVLNAVREGGDVSCGLEAARAQTLCIHGAHRSMPSIASFPEQMTIIDQQLQATWVEGLSEAISLCYEGNMLTHEAGFDWAAAGEKVDLRSPGLEASHESIL